MINTSTAKYTSTGIVNPVRVNVSDGIHVPVKGYSGVTRVVSPTINIEKDDDGYTFVIKDINGTRRVRLDYAAGGANVKYDTTANWNAKPEYVPSEGTIVIYSDYFVNEDGKVVAGVKIGDGNSYLVDLPFINSTQAIISDDSDIVKYDTTANWNSKTNYIPPKGTIILYSDYLVNDQGVNIPGMKVGDGSAFVVDLPFMNLSTREPVKTNSQIEYDTTANWENKGASYIPPAGNLIIYSDKYVNDSSKVPSIKIGDGKAYLADLPFANVDAEVAEVDRRLTDHINDKTAHITQEERDFWNNKVTVYAIDDNDATLVFTKRNISV